MSDSELAVVVAPQTFPTPILVERAGPSTRKKFFEFFTVPIRNANTRAAYYRAIQQFLAWVERAGYQQLEDIEPITVAAYIEILQRQAAPPTVKQHMAAIRMLFSWLTEKGVLAYTFARIGAAVNLKVEDYYPSGKRFLLRFKEKGGKEKELPVHHKLEELLDQYLKASFHCLWPGTDASAVPRFTEVSGTAANQESRFEQAYIQGKGQKAAEGESKRQKSS
jgi:site-specific recombinase XerD